jgi:hypothetical protein
MQRYAHESAGAGLRERIRQRTHKGDCFLMHSVHSLHPFSYWTKHPDSDAYPGSASACKSTRVSGTKREYDNVCTSETVFMCTVFALYMCLATGPSILTQMRTELCVRMQKYAHESAGAGQRERIRQRTHKRNCFCMHSVHSLHVFSFWVKDPDSNAHPSSSFAFESM